MMTIKNSKCFSDENFIRTVLTTFISSALVEKSAYFYW